MQRKDYSPLKNNQNVTYTKRSKQKVRNKSIICASLMVTLYPWGGGCKTIGFALEYPNMETIPPLDSTYIDYDDRLPMPKAVTRSRMAY